MARDGPLAIAEGQRWRAALVNTFPELIEANLKNLLPLSTLEVFYIIESKALATAQRDPQGGILRCEATFYGWTIFYLTSMHQSIIFANNDIKAL
jgi:hypothetical protein